MINIKKPSYVFRIFIVLNDKLFNNFRTDSLNHGQKIDLDFI